MIKNSVWNEKTKERHPYEIKTIHNVYNDDGEKIREEKFDLHIESSGTIRYFSFIQYVMNIVETGGIFIVDEMSARLHPILTKFIVDLFQGEKNQEAQLIFTTHDISLMNREQFRRNEITFVEKNRRGESSLYTLADIRARSDASFAKDYMAGKYGAIPLLSENDCVETVGEWLCRDLVNKESENHYILDYSNLLFETWLVMHFRELEPGKNNSKKEILKLIERLLDEIVYLCK